MQPLPLLLLQIVVILLAARVFGAIFPASSLDVLHLLSQIGR